MAMGTGRVARAVKLEKGEGLKKGKRGLSPFSSEKKRGQSPFSLSQKFANEFLGQDTRWGYGDGDRNEILKKIE
jgi:hypothetical protein